MYHKMYVERILKEKRKYITQKFIFDCLYLDQVAVYAIVTKSITFTKEVYIFVVIFIDLHFSKCFIFIVYLFIIILS